MLTLEQMIRDLSGQTIEGNTPITSAIIDSREAKPGALFIALPGESTDGHAYSDAALRAGASAAIIDKEIKTGYPILDLRPGQNPNLKSAISNLKSPVCLRVENALLALQEAARQHYRRWHDLPGRRGIGLTGSVGKSTVKEVVADVLSQKYVTHKNTGSFNNEIGLPLTVLHLRSDHERAVLEMGFYVLDEINLLTSIAPPEVGLVTNISPVHLERAGSIETILRGKGELLEALPEHGVAVLNFDDIKVMEMRQYVRNARVLTYGLTSKADVWADGIEGLGLDGVQFNLHYQGESRTVHLKLIGQHSVYPALGAAAIGFVEGVEWDQIVCGLEASQPIRLKAVDGPNGSLLIDDTYNASPMAVIAALNLLADLRYPRHVAVLGDMLELGAYEEEGHLKVGERAAEVADLLVTVGPRGRMIAQAAVHGGMTTAQVKVCETHEQAVEYLKENLQAGDAALIKGSRAVHMDRIVKALVNNAKG